VRRSHRLNTPAAASWRLGGEDRDPDETSEGDGWGPPRQVRAQVIIELLGGAFSPVAGRVAALRLSGARIVGSLTLSDAEIKQPVQLRGCRLDDGLDLAEARTRSLDLTRCHVRGLRLDGAHIEGNVGLVGAHLADVSGHALTADGLVLSGNLFCRDGFRSRGEIRLLGASIGGQLDLGGAHLANPGGNALSADQMVVTEGMYCQDGFRAEGGISLYRTNIGVLCDEPGSWPRRLVLDGFTYEVLYPYLPAGRRLRWLRRMDDYRAQPYEQLATYDRRLGHDEQARQVLLARMRARTNERPWWARSWGWFQDVLPPPPARPPPTGTEGALSEARPDPAISPYSRI
jgi:hypothetical protein